MHYGRARDRSSLLGSVPCLQRSSPGLLCFDSHRHLTRCLSSCHCLVRSVCKIDFLSLRQKKLTLLRPRLLLIEGGVAMVDGTIGATENASQAAKAGPEGEKPARAEKMGATKEEVVGNAKPTTREKEASVGIRCYASQPTGPQGASIGGIFKQRFTDFVVREVDSSGRIAELTELTLRRSAKEKTEEAGAKEDAPTEEKPKTEQNWVDNNDALKELESLVGESDAKAFADWVERRTSKSLGLEKGRGDNDVHLVLAPNNVKDERTRVHRFFKSKQHLFPLISTDTLINAAKGADKPAEQKHVRLFAVTGDQDRKRKRGMDHRSFRELKGDGDDGRKPKYCKFLLYKENLDTQSALQIVSKQLRCKPNRLGYAGTKDKRGVTLQWCTGFRVAPKQLERVNQQFREGRNCTLRVGNIEEHDQGRDARALVLGDLKGNHFVVILREVREEAKAAAEESARMLGQNGFINYYGLQRFGTGGAPTHMVGIELIKGNWMKACRLILSGRNNEYDRVKRARQTVVEILEDRKSILSDKAVRADMKEAMRAFPSKGATAEVAIVRGLLERGETDLVGALSAIPKTLKMMYIHAYQSYLWNNAASVRMEAYARDHAVAGDLVFLDQTQTPRSMTYAKEEDLEGGKEKKQTLPEVRFVTKEEEEARAVSIDRVILPLPGSQTKLPQNKVCEVYKDLLLKDGIDMSASSHKVKDFSVENVAGAYRSLVNIPANVKVDFVQYDRPDDQILITDLQKLENKELRGVGKGSRHALKLEFTLSSSCYASMVIRELTKGSVSGMT